MEYISYFFRFLYRIRWWLIIGPVAVALVVIYKTQHLTRTYEVETTIYADTSNGLNPDPEASVQNRDIVNSAIDNMINIIMAKNTLKHVSMRLFAQDMMYGDLNKDNNYIKASNYQHLWSITPNAVKKLIDKNSEEKTVKSLFAYADADTKNFLYGLFNWSPPYYSYDALSKISVRRLGNSNMLEIKYTADDPGIAYHTLALLNEEFQKQYQSLHFGETDKIIRFFEQELSKNKDQLTESEDALTNYNVEKKIVNYDEQTKHLAELSRDFKLQKEDILLSYNSSKALSEDLEKRIGENARLLRNNNLFINKLNQISELSAQITQAETFQNDSSSMNNQKLNFYKKQLQKKEDDFKTFSDSFNSQKYTKEGYANSNLIEQWLSELLKTEEAKAKLKVMDQWESEIDKEYAYYSPIGSTIKRKEREINFTESSYLEILHSLNTAKLRQKSLQMTSATLRVLNPPTFPLSSAPTKRRMKIIISFFASFLFIFGYFLLLEILDHTLRDKIRTERITSGKVIGVFPGRNQLRYRRYSRTVKEITAKVLGNAILQFYTPERVFIINLISMESKEGKTFLAGILANYYTSIGFKIKIIMAQTDFNPDSKEFLQSKSVRDLYIHEEEDILLVEYPAMKQSFVPGTLLKEANINILVARATRTWKNTDRNLLENLKEHSQSTPVRIVLNQTKREEVEYFTGLLPPYTRIRKFIYRISQLGLTATEKPA